MIHRKKFYPRCALPAFMLMFALAVTPIWVSGDQQRPIQFDRQQALSISRSAIGNTLPDLVLQKPDGSYLGLQQLAGKPLIISMIFTSCHHICPATTAHLNKVVMRARQVLGEDSFNVITVGFDVFRDKPQMMGYFADQQGVHDDNWYFLSTDQATIDTLAEQLGFIYYSTPNGFDHLVQTTLLDETLIVYRQIYGITFDMPLLVEPLKELVFDKKTDSIFSTVSNQIKLFCTVYDPAQNKYRFDYSLFIGTFIGFMCVFVLGLNLVKEWRKSMALNR